MVRAADLKSGDPEFKSHSNRQLDLCQVVHGSTPRLYLSDQLARSTGLPPARWDS